MKTVVVLLALLCVAPAVLAVDIDDSKIRKGWTEEKKKQFELREQAERRRREAIEAEKRRIGAERPRVDEKNHRTEFLPWQP